MTAGPNAFPAAPKDAFPAATILGYPRIGPHRELKRALESYWNGRSSRDDLASTSRGLREATWRRLTKLGLETPPSNTFSLYDHVLDTAFMLDAVPERYRAADDVYFAMARGTDDVAPLRMTKWFDTNYHYIVPEIGPETAFRLADDKPLREVAEARELGIPTRPVLLGPVTFLLLSQASAGSPDGFTPLHRLNDVLDVYARLLTALAAEGVDWVQLDEPALVADRSDEELVAVRVAYERLGGLDLGLGERPRLFVSSYFGSLDAALPVLADCPVEAVGLDLDRGRDVLTRLDLGSLAGKTVVAGVVPGRNVWRTHLNDALDTLRFLRSKVGEVTVSTSCSLLHVPHDLDLEPGLDPALRERLAFADQKVGEVVELARLLAAAPDDAVTAPPARRRPQAPDQLAERTASDQIAERSPHPVRAAAQADHLRLPPLPVTTIGSFPQTGDIRAARAALAAGEITAERYERLVKVEIERAVRLQERLGLDVLVHGEPERNDMVQYFAEHLDGFAITRHGWVQSYGSRCTRPPILHGDVGRPAPITVGWARYAQSLTAKPVKGMLTGPVTIVAWSFVREDRPLKTVFDQVADAIRAEVADLEAAGVSIIQVDEPALRELLPLRRADQAAYLSRAVGAYRRATSVAADRTQIHTHLCYSDAAQVLTAIDALDADVTTIESARSNARVLADPAMAGFGRGLGPGVYDIHSPRVPAAEEITGLVETILGVLPAEQVWINPDCGLKTRTYEQVEAALANVVTATARLRERLAVSR
ncbi:5-methyltetrahydropteroyltriglutamate--homocysteine S-methyltransferase [Spirillospora sp. NPDC048911]|uniref:5-methyltetrahydropteroyltriglutamate-- homocysteine S-methyltransferase n=1 Tax=Spirillospora sp. NPDC048911 TaxID=3364527 RepID=UPI003712B533